VGAAPGPRDECLAAAGRSIARCEPIQLALTAAWARAAIGLCELSAGHHAAAADVLDELDVIWQNGHVGEPSLLWWQADHIEALIACGRIADAQAALDRLTAHAHATGRTHALGVATRCRALLSDDPVERIALLEESCRAMTDVGAPFELARGLLARGEAHIARGDRVAGARDLAEARTIFDRLGARPWSDRASAGRSERASPPQALADRLTDAELRVAVTVGTGATNGEVAAQLFVSVKTVEYHLSNIYRKLGIRSRVALARYVAEHS
jgi:DNA-binding CsgD family transcriptional regulator